MSGSLASLGRRFWSLASARTVSVAGNGFGRVALAFAVLDLPGAGPATVSLVLACQALPQLALVLLGGAIADRMSRARLMLLAELAAAAAWSGLTAVLAVGVSNLAVVCLLAAIAGAATSMFTPAMSGIVPELVSGEQLQRANALIRLGQNAALLLGLGLSGVVVGELGAVWALGINAASFAASAALITTIRVPNPARGASSLLADLRQGGRDFFSRQWLWVVVVQFAVVVAALNATVGVLGPLQALHHYGGARTWSLIVGGQAVGTLAGAGLAARLRVRRPVRVAVLVSFTFALPMLLLGLGVNRWWVATAMLAAGAANDVFGVLWSTTMQHQIPRHLISRVSAYDIFGSISFAPLGLLVAGPVAAKVGTGTTLIGCAAVTVIATAAALLSPGVRHLAGPAAEPAGAAAVR